MVIQLGSKNPCKIEAVHKLAAQHSQLADLEIHAAAVASGVANQPLSLSETIKGAKNRAKGAFELHPQSMFGVGIEGGMFPVPEARTAFMNICAAVFFDGSEYYLGLSSAFEHPKAAVNLVVHEGMEIKDAYVQAQFKDSSEFAKTGGAIAFMSDNKLSRQDYCLQALVTAFASYTKRDLL